MHGATINKKLPEVVVAYFEITQNLCEGTQDNKEIARSIATT